MVMSKDELIKTLEENGFNVHIFEQDGEECAEIESWTEGGINMIAVLQPISVESFEAYVVGFDIDDEIDLHRQDPLFKKAFTTTESLEEFQNYSEYLHTVLKIIKTNF